MTNSDNDDVEYCAECGDPEFDKDGIETHADEDEYDHDFELGEEIEENGDNEDENDGITMDDIKKGADTLTSVAKAAKAFKDLTDDATSKQTRNKYGFTTTPRPPHDERKSHTVKIMEYFGRTSKSDNKNKLEGKIDKLSKKIDHGHKSQNQKWYIGIGIGVVIAIILAVFL